MKSQHGFSPKALWGSKKSQEIRFDILTKCIAPTNEKIKVLDVGSGFGGISRVLCSKSKCKSTALELQKDISDMAKYLTKKCR